MEELKKLFFNSEWYEPIVSGVKQISIRYYRPDAHYFTKGEVVLGAFPENKTLELEITSDTLTKRFLELTQEELLADGFKDLTDCFNTLKKYYPNVTEEDTAGVIKFQLFGLTDD